MASSSSGAARQSGVVPYRTRKDLEVLLITSRRRGRWVLPKGFIEPHLSPRASAANEAYEEAGVRGRVGRDPLGRYRVKKRGGAYTVVVFPMLVTEVLDAWPEDGARRRRWASVPKALSLLSTPALRRIVRLLPSTLD